MNHIVKITEKEWLSHNMIRLVLEKPKDYKNTIGQAIELTIDTPEFMEKFAPFTLTSLPDADSLELMIKIYPERKGLTLALSKLAIKDKIIITDAWDSYEYRGKGTFIAGGSGITPFIPMIRDLRENNTTKDHHLIFANRNSKDIILKNEFENALGRHYVNILSEEKGTSHDFGRIDRKYLKQMIIDFDQQFYLCGPDAFSESIKNNLISLGAKEDRIQIGY